MVVMTHLHRDHVGWNLLAEDGTYAPTFPSALVLGDTAHSPVQIQESDWVSRADMNPDLTRQTRRALLDRLEHENILVAAGHFEAPGFGKIVRLQGRRYWRGF